MNSTLDAPEGAGQIPQGLSEPNAPASSTDARSVALSDAVILAASEWLCERAINDWDEADLMRALIHYHGDWPGCPECYHEECDEPCVPRTEAQKIAGLDSRIAQLIHDGKIHAHEGYKPPDGWKPIEIRCKARPIAAAPEVTGSQP